MKKGLLIAALCLVHVVSAGKKDDLNNTDNKKNAVSLSIEESQRESQREATIRPVQERLTVLARNQLDLYSPEGVAYQERHEKVLARAREEAKEEAIRFPEKAKLRAAESRLMDAYDKQERSYSTKEEALKVEEEVRILREEVAMLKKIADEAEEARREEESRLPEEIRLIEQMRLKEKAFLEEEEDHLPVSYRAISDRSALLKNFSQEDRLLFLALIQKIDFLPQETHRAISSLLSEGERMAIVSPLFGAEQDLTVVRTLSPEALHVLRETIRLAEEEDHVREARRAEAVLKLAAMKAESAIKVEAFKEEMLSKLEARLAGGNKAVEEKGEESMEEKRIEAGQPVKPEEETAPQRG